MHDDKRAARNRILTKGRVWVGGVGGKTLSGETIHKAKKAGRHLGTSRMGIIVLVSYTLFSIYHIYPSS